MAHAGANDTFIINDNFGVYGGASNSFTLNFTNFTIVSLSFDWEIFPDPTCAQGSYCAGHPNSPNWPDIELMVDGNAASIWSMLATTPVGGRDPQALGLSGPINFLNGVQPHCTPLQTPEPATLPLVALALGAAALGAGRARVGRTGARG